MTNLNELKASLIEDINRRLNDKIIEPTNATLLIKLINNAENEQEALAIAELGTTYRRTGFHFDKRLEKTMGTDIKYLKRNNVFSFGDDNTKNKLIIGDNYDALLNLLVTHKGLIDVIYIDPPYGSDSMGEFAETNYVNAITRDNLLSMLYPRLLLARQLLSDEGVIFCSIDDKNQAYVKCLFDEIFESHNFIATIIWERAYSPVNLKKHFSESHDYVLCYARDIEMATCNGLPRSEEANERYGNPDNDPRGNWKSGDLSVGPCIESKVYEIVTPSGRKVLPPSGYCWRLDRDTFEQYVRDNRIWFGVDGNNVPSIKRFLSEVKQGITPMTIWKYTDVGHSQDATKELKSIFDKAVFTYPKPVKLIKQLLRLYSKPDSVILDFFVGSGTTGQAAMELNNEDGGNRQFILCTNNEITDTTPCGIAYDVTAKRLKRVMTGECYDGSNDFEWIKKHAALGGSLDVYEIAEVNNSEQAPGKTPFDVIDESCYGLKFDSIEEKISWICTRFANTQYYLKEV